MIARTHARAFCFRKLFLWMLALHTFYAEIPSSGAPLENTSIQATITTRIDVRLVGFDSHDARVLEQNLIDHFSEPWSSLERDNSDTVSELRSSEAIRQRTLFHVESDLEENLLGPVSKTLNALIHDEFLSSIPVAAVDSLIKKDFEFRENIGSKVLYILCPNIRHERVFFDEEDEADESESDPRGWRIPSYWYSDKAGSRCGLQCWVANHKTYAWVDLQAGPSQYGPLLGGEGAVVQGTFPKCSRSYLPQISNFVHLTSAVLFAPALRTVSPMLLSGNATILFIEIVDVVGTGVGIRESDTSKRLNHLVETMAIPESTPEFQYIHVNTAECYLCALALVKSRKHGGRDVAAHGLRAHRGDFLDSHELWGWRNTIINSIAPFGMQDKAVFPVLFFNLSQEEHSVQLDDHQEAVAFPGGVLAVSTKASRGSLVDFTCSGNHQIVEHGDTMRAIMSSLLEALWGVLPPFKFWDEIHVIYKTDWIWGSSNTLFGRLSHSESHTLLVQSVAHRNLIYTIVKRSLGDFIGAFNVLQTCQDSDPTTKEVLDRMCDNTRDAFNRVASFLSVLDSSNAFHEAKMFSDRSAFFSQAVSLECAKIEISCAESLS